MIFFDGRFHTNILDEQIKDSILKKKPSKKLAIIMIGNNQSSDKYVSIKEKLCLKFGIPVLIERIDERLSNDVIEEKVKRICLSQNVGGVIIQLPLPRKSLNSILSLIPEEKDIDLISPNALGKYYSGDFSKLSPVVRSFKYFINNTGIKLENTYTTIIGMGLLVGEPLGYFLLQQEAKVQFILDYKPETSLNCQLLILSAGYPALVKGERIPEGCNVVDFGSSVVDGKTIGDLDLKSEIDHLGAVSPSPGGMGPLVTRYLIMNYLGI